MSKIDVQSINPEKDSDVEGDEDKSPKARPKGLTCSRINQQFHEYANETSIHGIKFAAEESRTFVERYTICKSEQWHDINQNGLNCLICVQRI